MALAEHLAGDTMYKKRVLAIDLAPQSNLTSTGRRKYTYHFLALQSIKFS